MSSSWDHNGTTLVIQPAMNCSDLLPSPATELCISVRTQVLMYLKYNDLYASQGIREWRRGWESNPRIKVLQTSALPLGYRAAFLG